MIYLASPYTHSDPAVRKQRFQCVKTALFLLLRDRVWAYSPIVHCHELARENKLPTTHDFWLEYDFDFLRRCDALYTLILPGWEDSKGVAEERAVAHHVFIPRKLMHIDFHEYDVFYTLENDLGKPKTNNSM
jgi:hypothetical protein